MKQYIPKNDKIFFVISIITFFVLSSMVMIERNYLAQPHEARQTVCASDSLVCPDGSVVSRTLPNCSFAPCPAIVHATATPQTATKATTTPIHRSANVCTMEAKMCPDGSSVSRSGPKCSFAPCPNPPPPPNTGTSGACTKDSDCALGYSCIDVSPVAREGFQNLQCWKNGAPRPICLSGETRIKTPYGEKFVKDIMEGDMVVSVDKTGKSVLVPVRIAAHTQAPPEHHVVNLVLADGRRLIASPGHPLDDGRKLGSLRAMDTIHEVQIISATLERYTEQYTYDILPASDTGMYFANGILLRSTLTK